MMIFGMIWVYRLLTLVMGLQIEYHTILFHVVWNILYIKDKNWANGNILINTVIQFTRKFVLKNVALSIWKYALCMYIFKKPSKNYEITG